MRRSTLTTVLATLGLCSVIVGMVFAMMDIPRAYGLSFNMATILWIGAFLAKN